LRIAEAFCKMRLSDYCASIDIDRAIGVAVDSFVGSQKVSAKKALPNTLSTVLVLYELLLGEVVKRNAQQLSWPWLHEAEEERDDTRSHGGVDGTLLTYT
jgi:hypothetical protein